VSDETENPKRPLGDMEEVPTRKEMKAKIEALEAELNEAIELAALLYIIGFAMGLISGLLIAYVIKEAKP